MHIAASNGSNAILGRLLAAGAKPKVLPNGSTLMHMAAIGGNAETVELVLKTGASQLIALTNVTSFSSLRKIPPRVPFEVLRKITCYFETPDSEHKLDPSYEDTDPSANPDNVKIFKDLQKLQSVGLVVPVDAEFMYFAALRAYFSRPEARHVMIPRTRCSIAR